MAGAPAAVHPRFPRPWRKPLVRGTNRAVIHILFPLGVRLSTIVTALAFVTLALARRDKLPIIAGWVWLISFEAVFQIASLALDRLPLGLFSPTLLPSSRWGDALFHVGQGQA